MEHLEGRQSVLAALRARQRRFQVILVRHGAHLERFQDVLDLARELNVPVKAVDRRELDAMAHGQTHGGIVALAGPKPRTSVDELLALVDGLRTSPPLLLLIEGVEDARNLGFTLRSAEALGAHAVLIKKHLWDFDPVEVARPASGAYERLPLVQIDSTDPLIQLQRRGLRLHGCVAGAKRTIYDVDLAGPSILAIGGEKRGLSGAVRSLCDRFITIPSVGGEATSLSLSHASAVILAEAMRQRLVRANAVNQTAAPDPPHPGSPLPPRPPGPSSA
ncbi:MAG TPA: RNA methyltransferase [Tepidisphaeraceae bacterium]|jgi:23S rRNA (guanosine2251-2'-O)-methyltransferase